MAKIVDGKSLSSEQIVNFNVSSQNKVKHVHWSDEHDFSCSFDSISETSESGFGEPSCLILGTKQSARYLQKPLEEYSSGQEDFSINYQSQPDIPDNVQTIFIAAPIDQ